MIIRQTISVSQSEAANCVSSPDSARSLKRLKQAEAKLWQGQVDEAIAYFAHCHRKQAHNFCAYLEKHRHRLVNYQYFQEQQLSSIGSGAVESAVKLS